MKKNYRLGNQEIPGEEVEFETESERWNTYILHDGSKLKLKTVVAKIIRLEAHKPDGEPVYLVQSSNIVHADVPDILMKQDDQP
ncbi:MAG TPA: hypothetical protein VML01_12555 [Bryobacterales bacterium]|nr:hypothetical protein [Bryobacterales bacterium]